MNAGLISYALISAAFSAAAVLFFWRRQSDFLTFFVVLGQAHFLLTYLAQTRAGRMSVRRAWLLVLAGVLIILPLFLIRGIGQWYTLTASVLFAAHFSGDFLHMAGVKQNPASEAVVVSVALLFVLLVGRILFGFQSLTIAGLALLPAFFVIPVSEYSRGEARIPLLGMLTVAGLLFGLYVSSVKISIGYLLGPIILFHYAHWYFYMIGRAEQGRYTRTYFSDVLIVNAVVAAVYFGCHLHPRLAVVNHLFFTSPWFFAWTILHILFTARFRLLGLGSHHIESPA